MLPAPFRLRRGPAALLLAALVAWAGNGRAEEDTVELAAAAQNPVAAMISLPLQNNTFFGVGPDDDWANVLNVQPVIPIGLGEWNVISRTIAPLIAVPDSLLDVDVLPAGGSGGGNTFGLGDINQSLYLSPARPGRIVWGIGPSLTLPTATEDELGTGKWSAGPTAVVLTMDGPWVYGALVRNLWSFAGSDDHADVNQFLLQPFVNYNMAKGWYLASTPIITANWEAPSGEEWTVPLGGGFGRIMTIGSQPINLSAQAFYNVETPTFGPDWSMRVTLQFLFPK